MVIPYKILTVNHWNNKVLGESTSIAEAICENLFYDVENPIFDVTHIQEIHKESNRRINFHENGNGFPKKYKKGNINICISNREEDFYWLTISDSNGNLYSDTVFYNSLEKTLYVHFDD